MNTWKSMDSAPKDGRRILLIVHNAHDEYVGPAVGYWGGTQTLKQWKLAPYDRGENVRAICWTDIPPR
jgi:hypothetical protein